MKTEGKQGRGRYAAKVMSQIRTHEHLLSYHDALESTILSGLFLCRFNPCLSVSAEDSLINIDQEIRREYVELRSCLPCAEPQEARI